MYLSEKITHFFTKQNLSYHRKIVGLEELGDRIWKSIWGGGIYRRLTGKTEITGSWDVGCDEFHAGYLYYQIGITSFFKW